MAEKSQMGQPAPPPYPGQGGQPPMGYQAAPGQPPVATGQPPPQFYQQGSPLPAGYAAVPPGPPPMVGATATTVIVQNFGMVPASCNCPNCHQNVVTRTEYEVGLFAWLIAGIIFICGGWIFCLCFIPFCVDSMKDVRHVCPNCNYTIHYFKRM